MNDADRTILDRFVQTRDKTLQILDVVPDDLMGQTAAAEENPLCWQFDHIAISVDWWMQHVMQDGHGFANDPQFEKNVIKDKLVASRDRLVSFFTADDAVAMAHELVFLETDGGKTKWIGRERVLYLAAHELHHLGRAELALWQWGLTDLPDFL